MTERTADPFAGLFDQEDPNDPFAGVFSEEPQAQPEELAKPVAGLPHYMQPGLSPADRVAGLLLNATMGPLAQVPFGEKIINAIHPDLLNPVELMSYGETNKELQPLSPQPRDITNPVVKFFDNFQRGQYFSIKFQDVLLQEGLDGLGKAFREGASEAWTRETRPRGADLIRKYKPEFARQNPIATQTLGFLDDVILDPLNLASFLPLRRLSVPLGRGVAMLTKGGEKILQSEFTRSARLWAETLEQGFDAIKIGIVPKVEQANEVIDLLKKGSLDDAETAFTALKNEATTKSTFFMGDALDTDLAKFTQYKSKIPVLARESADKKVAYMIEHGAKHLKETPGIFLGPSGHEWKVPGSGELFDKLGWPVRELKEYFSGIPVIKKVATAVSDFEVTPKVMGRDETTGRFTGITGGKLQRIHREVLDRRSDYVNAVDEDERDIAKLVFNMGKDFNKDEATQLGRIVHSISDATEMEKKRLGRALTNEEVERIRNLPFDNATPKEKALVTRFYDEMNRQGEMEMEAGLLDDMLPNYAPRLYDIYSDPSKMKIYRQWKKDPGLSSYLSAAEHREFQFLQDAEAAGFKPDYNLLNMLAVRLIQGRRALRREDYKQFLNSHYVVKSEKELPIAIQKDLGYLGDMNFSLAGGSDLMRGIFKVFDHVNNIFRFSAVPARVATAFKQGAVQNPMQEYLKYGLHAFRALDPRMFIPTLAMIWRHHGFIGDKLANRISNVGLDALRFTMRSPLNKGYDSEMLYQEAKALGRFVDVSVTGDYESNVIRELKQHQKNYQLGFKNESLMGAVSFFKDMANVTKWPSYMEEFAHIFTWLNGIMLGHGTRESSRMTEHALFNYKHGLKEVERQVIRRFFRPFFSFERFATTFLADTLLKRPARIANVKKLAENFFDGWNAFKGGQTLTPEQQAIVGAEAPYLLEQPFTLEGFDEHERAVFKRFTNFTPIELAEGLEVDKNGNIDPVKSMQRFFFASVAPLIRIPLEVLSNKKWFTGSPIAGKAWETKRKGDPTRKGARLGAEIEPEELLTAMATSLFTKQLGAPAAIGQIAANKNPLEPIFSAMTPDELKDWIKDKLAWREEINPVTGKRDVFINPWIAYALMDTIYPNMRTFIRMEDEDWTPTERLQYLLYGVGTTKKDLDQMEKFKNQKDRYERLRLQKMIRELNRSGQPNEAEEAQQELNNLLGILADDADLREAQAADPFAGTFTPEELEKGKAEDPFAGLFEGGN